MHTNDINTTSHQPTKEGQHNTMKLQRTLIDGHWCLIHPRFIEQVKRFSKDTEAELKHHTGFLNLETNDAAHSRIYQIVKVSH